MLFLFPSISYTSFTVQLGAFSEKQRAETFAEEIKTHNFVPFVVEQNALFMVWVGYFETRLDAQILQKKIKGLGFDAIIKEIKDQNIIADLKLKSKKQEEAPKITPAQPTHPRENIQKETTRKESIIKMSSSPPLDEFSLLQVAVFQDIERARKLKAELESKNYFSFIISETKHNLVLYKVVVGQKGNIPLSETLNSLKSEYEVVIIK